MYIELKSDNSEQIISEIQKVMDVGTLTSITLSKRDGLYAVTLVQCSEPAASETT